MLKIFSERYNSTPAEQGTPLTLINASIEKIPLPDESIDNVIVSAVFLHNHKDLTRKSIDEVYRVLKPNGKVFILESFPALFNLTGLLGSAYILYLQLTGKKYKNGPVRYFHSREVRKLLRKFNGVEINPSGFVVLPKSIIYLPYFINQIYRRYISDPVNDFLEPRLPTKIKKVFRVHHNVIAQKLK